MLSIETLNSMYGFEKPTLQSAGYDDLESQELSRLVSQILSDPAILGSDAAEDFAIKLREISLYSRAGLWTPEGATDFWSERGERLLDSFIKIKHRTQVETNDRLQDLADRLVPLATASAKKRAETVRTQLRDKYKSYALISQKSRLGELANTWLEASSLSDRAKTLRTMSELGNISRENFDAVLFLGSCMNFVRREKWDRYLRVLLLGGLSRNHVFVSPNWQQETNEKFLLEKLIPGLPNRIQLDWRLELTPPLFQDLPSSALLDAVAEIDVALDSIPSFRTAEPLRAGGTIECRLIELQDELVYPVEVDSEKIAILRPDSTGRFTTANRRLSQLSPGDILLARQDASETGALREYALRSLGNQGKEVASSQDAWKSRISAFIEDGNLNNLKKRLKDRGVVHYDRVPYWGEPLTLGPQLNSDFNELLVELGFSATETLGHLRCKSALLRALILSGQKARNSVVELITPENHAALSDGKTVSIRVENLGDAIYLLAPIKRVINGTVTCHPQQVRQVAKKG